MVHIISLLEQIYVAFDHPEHLSDICNVLEVEDIETQRQ